LQDQIAELEHKPKSNYLKEAILENADAMDQWANRSIADYSKTSVALGNYIGLVNMIKNSFLNFDDAPGSMQRLADAATRVKVEMQVVAEATGDLAAAKPGTDDYASAVAVLIRHEQDLAAVTKAGMIAAKEYGSKGQDALLELTQLYQTSTAAVRNLTDEQVNGALRVKVANLHQNKDNLKPLEDQAAWQKIVTAGVEQHSQALIKLARTQAETTVAATKGGEDDSIDGRLAKQKAAIEAEKDDSIAAANSALIAKEDCYGADMKAAAGNTAKKKELTAQYVNDIHAYDDSIVQFNADANKQIVTAEREAANQRAAIAKELQKVINGGGQQLDELNSKDQLKADEQASKNRIALGKQTNAQTLQRDLEFNKRATQIDIDGLNTQIKNLVMSDKNYLAQKAEFENKKNQVVQKGMDQEKAIRVAAAQKMAMDIKSSEDRMKDAIAGDIANSIVMNKSLAASFRQTGEQMAEQMIKNLIMMELTGDKEKLIHAKSAYGKAFDAMSGIPPAPVWGYAAGALAFAAVMSFEAGGKIPGDGPVPIEGHGGETVVTKALTDRVESSEKSGGKSGGQHTWNFAPTVHAMDAEGVDRVLAKHASVFQRHVGAQLRRMNK
jgi:hypothetical protein